MKVIYDSRGSGKTTKAIQRSAETGFYIITLNRKSAENIATLARKMKLTIPFPLTFEEFIEKIYFSSGVKEIIIDDADQLLTTLSRVRIDTITMTRENK
jgi:hypothetical protein